METYGSRLLSAINHKAVSRKDLAAALGISVQAVGLVIRGETASFTAENNAKAAKFLGISSDWLATGKGSMQHNSSTATSEQPKPPIEPSNVELVKLPHAGMVPLISWVQAGNFCSGDLSFETVDAEEWYICPVPHSKRTYALKVRGSSMHNPNGRPTYEEGEIIFVDSEKEAKPGDRVIACLESSGQATFKQLMEEDGRCFLKALNPNWTPQIIELTEPARVCGPVIGKWTPE